MSSRAVLKSYFETGDVPTQIQFADLIDSLALVDSPLFGPSFGDRIRIATAIVKPTITGNAVGWTFINDAEHATVFFNSIATPTGTVLRIGYPPVSQVLLAIATGDETMVKFGTTIGASVGLSHLDLTLSAQFLERQYLTYFTGATWANSQNIFATNTIAGTVTTVTSDATGTADRDDQFGHIPFEYCGTLPKMVRGVFSGLGYRQSKFELVSLVTGLVVAPDVGDRVALTNPSTTHLLSTVTPSFAERHIYAGASNIFLLGMFAV